jgi:poly-beta-1,6-N-acetyl-D-glucosamine synthase
MFRRYVVISPVRDEAQHLEHTIRSMLCQTVRPTQWILVNDGSTDGTAEIIDRWASEHFWITPVHRTECSRIKDGPSTTQTPAIGNRRDRGGRAREAKEIQAFYEGYKHISSADWEFMVKLDGDVSFEADYFETCFSEFDADPKLGIGGGVILNSLNGRLSVETTPQFHVRGATKIYRRACWDEIGGVTNGPGWDTLDQVKANMLGWSSRSFSALRVIHHRPTGAANGAWQNALKNGLWAYISGYHPLYMLFRCARRLPEKPYLVGSLALLCGFMSGYVHRIPQNDDERLTQYLRQQQLNRLLFRDSIWK